MKTGLSSSEIIKLTGLSSTVNIKLSPIAQHHQLLRIWPCGLFQFRITSELMNQFRHLVGLLGRVIGPSQGLYLHSTAQHRKTGTNTHALSEFRTHDPSIQAAKTNALDQAAIDLSLSNHTSNSSKPCALSNEACFLLLRFENKDVKSTF
jgi:hypothetical protein